MSTHDNRASPFATDAILSCFARIIEAALHTRSLEELGLKIQHIIAPHIPARNLFLAVLEEEDGLLRFPFWVDHKDPPPIMKNPGRGTTEYILQTGEPLFADAETLDTLSREKAFEILGTRPRYWFGVPLKRLGKTIGVFVVQAYEDDPPLEPRHAEFLSNLSSAIAVAVLAHRNIHTSDRRDAMLRAAADAAEQFLQDPDWTRHIDLFLSRIGQAARASRSYIFTVDKPGADRITVSQRYEWVAEGVASELNNPALQHFDFLEHGVTRWLQLLQQGESIGGPVYLLPPNERPILEVQGIQSFHLVPIHVRESWWGFIGFDDCREPRAWSHAEREALRLAAQVLSHAIHRERSDAQLRLQSTALSAAANGILITDVQGRIVWVNDAFCRLTGYSPDEVLGKTPAILNSGHHDAAFYRNMWQTILAGHVWQGEVVNRRKDGRLIAEEMTITPVRDPIGKLTHFIAIKQDITERKQLLQQLIHAQKMESIGRLAGGIAHDFNNLLQAIAGFSAILLSEMVESDPRRLDVMEIDRAAQRAAVLTRQLLTFSRRQKLEMTVLSLNDVVRRAENLLRRLLPENIAINLCLDPALPMLYGDASQIEQVLVNLAINARDAMPDGGRICITTTTVHFTPESIPPIEGARAGRFALLVVEDSGRGMSAEVLERLFEPFFTTKEPGRGTGLGLSVVYGIVRQHEGFIQVLSALGMGTKILVHLPIDFSRDPISSSPPPTTDRLLSDRAGLLGHGEHILVLEDEESVRELSQRVLSNSGYRVTTASTIREARQLLSTPELAFDLIFSDVVLPDGNGLDLAEQARRDHPQLKVVLTSGYMQERERWSERIAALDGFLPKPYPPPALLRALRVALEPKSP